MRKDKRYDLRLSNEDDALLKKIAAAHKEPAAIVLRRLIRTEANRVKRQRVAA